MAVAQSAQKEVRSLSGGVGVDVDELEEQATATIPRAPTARATTSRVLMVVPLGDKVAGLGASAQIPCGQTGEPPRAFNPDPLVPPRPDGDAVSRPPGRLDCRQMSSHGLASLASVAGLAAAILLAPACSSSSSPASGPPAPTGVTVMFDASADLKSPDHFFDFPWPSDLRLSSPGTPDLTGMANPTAERRCFGACAPSPSSAAAFPWSRSHGSASRRTSRRTPPPTPSPRRPRRPSCSRRRPEVADARQAPARRSPRPSRPTPTSRRASSPWASAPGDRARAGARSTRTSS